MDWFETAGEYERDAAASRFGERTALAREWGKPRRLAPQTLRTYIAARRFVESLTGEAGDLMPALKRAPAIAVDTLAKWHARDPVRALEAARELAAGRLTVRKLADLEAQSRERRPARRKPAWISQLRALGECAAPSRQERRYKVDLIVRGVRAMAVGPYAVRDQYYAHAAEWLLKGLGTRGAVFGEAALLIPREGFDRFIGAGPRFRGTHSGSSFIPSTQAATGLGSARRPAVGDPPA